MQTAGTLEHEPRSVGFWQRERYLELGCTPTQARILAAYDIDWHRVAALLDAGCPLNVAIAILT